jgi:beta-lactamase superfamily II metal-dependent hydrolase
MDMGIDIQNAVIGHKLDLGLGAYLEIIDVGQHGAVLYLAYGQASFLLTPGADPEMIHTMQQQSSLPSVTALMLADSGYLAVNPPDFLAHMQPWVVLISVEAGNERKLPDPKVLEALQGTTILRTDQHGWIHCISDGKRFWVEMERDLE